MATIQFTGNGHEKTVRTGGGDGLSRTLLSIARLAGVPILFNCDVGDCAACVVVVRTLRVPAAGLHPLTEKERFLLRVMGRLSDADIADADAGRRPARVRLACQYRVGEEDIAVDYSQPMGGT
jgi:ferredoxin